MSVGKVSQSQSSRHKRKFELMNDGDDEAKHLSEEYGITEEDMELFSAFLEKPRF